MKRELTTAELVAEIRQQARAAAGAMMDGDAVAAACGLLDAFERVAQALELLEERQ